MKLYLWLRNTHLVLGLSCGLFLLVYGVSAVQMSHSGWFTLKPTVTQQTVEMEFDEPRAVARALMDRHGLRGELAQVKGTSFRLVRPGTVSEVTFDPVAHKAVVKTSVAGFMGMLNRIHHQAGMRHEYTLLNVWGVLVTIVSAGLLVLGATGLYLWFKLRPERKVGLVLLALSLGFSLPLVVSLRLAG